MDLSRTLNSQECVARGCAVQAAMLANKFKMPHYLIVEFNPLPIFVSYVFKNPQNRAGKQERIQSTEIFPVGGHYPYVNNLTWDGRRGGCDVIIHYSQLSKGTLLPGADHNIAKYSIDEGVIDKKLPTTKVIFQLSFLNSSNGMPMLQKAEFFQEWQEPQDMLQKASSYLSSKKTVPKRVTQNLKFTSTSHAMLAATK